MASIDKGAWPRYHSPSPPPPIAQPCRAMPSSPRISVIGLGYVGLPLAVALARHFTVVGFDIAADRVAELQAGVDRTGEIGAEELASTSLNCSADAASIRGSDVFIITVPTPVDEHNAPDLGPVIAACRAVGEHLAAGAIVVLESTVYPGVTEDVCGPALAQASGLASGRDFFLGYSPERINPGDREHTIERITKVVAGQTPEAVERLAALYGAITAGGVFVARDIRTAEAAKVIENAQRDINIAFVNEVTMIFQKLGLSAYDVFDAAATKWNFLGFAPGLVGGHCIGIDPYYLAHGARAVGHEPEVVLAGRRVNDGMGRFVAEQIDSRLTPPARVLVLGLTFKENVPDLRNTKVVDIVSGLESRGHEVDVHDPLADRAAAQAQYGLELKTDLDALGGYDCLVAAVTHDAYKEFGDEQFRALVKDGGLVADVKGLWRHRALPEELRRWQF